MQNRLIMVLRNTTYERRYTIYSIFVQFPSLKAAFFRKHKIFLKFT